MSSPSHVEVALAAEEARAFTLAMRVRVVALLVIGIWLGIEQPIHAVVFLWTFLGGFLLLGAIPLWLRRNGRWGGPWPWIFPALDAVLLATTILVPNPLDEIDNPIAQRLRFGNEVYFFALIAFSGFTYSPRLVLWQGFVSALAWIAGGLVALASEGSFTVLARARWEAMSPDDILALVADPYFVPFPTIARPAVLFLLVAGTIATLVWRARRLVVHQAHAERARANLARYFSPNLVDELAESDAPFATSRSHDCAVLFADVVGFTQLAAAEPPERVIAFLREYHARMERAVFDHGGTVDKYVGDGMMATFGTPVPGANDAVRALRCAREMVRAVAEWSAARVRSGEGPVRIGIGLAYGPVVLGDIGGPGRLEFAVLGDTVNVASRLEGLTRTLGGPIVASDVLVHAIRIQTTQAEADELLADMTSAPSLKLRGREDTPIDAWVGPTVTAASDDRA